VSGFDVPVAGDDPVPAGGSADAIRFGQHNLRWNRWQCRNNEPVVPGRSAQPSPDISYSPRQRSHTLCEIPFSIPVFGAIRANGKTARRFCFSPHFPPAIDDPKAHASANTGGTHAECEKCGLGRGPWKPGLSLRPQPG
jgi:hypothetical protein